MENEGKKMLESAQALIKETAKNLGFDEEIIKRLIEPEMICEFSFPVKMDDGQIKVLRVGGFSIIAFWVLIKGEFGFIRKLAAKRFRLWRL